MDNENVRTYSKILSETLKKKKHILEELERYTRAQGSILSEEGFDEEAFSGCMDEKQQLILELEECDNGFDNAYSKVQEDLIGRKQEFRPEIEKLQALIKACTELGVAIQTLEQQNHLKFQVKIADNKQKLSTLKQNNKVAASYYKNMANQHQPENSYFMDKKK